VWNSLIFREWLFSSVVTQNSFIVYRRLYLVLAWWLQGFQYIMSIYAATLRIIYMILITAFSLLRLDIHVMPKGLETYDTGPSSFAAMLFMHERINSPVVSEFLDSIFVPISLHGIDNLERQLEDTPEADRCPLLVSRAASARQALDKKKEAMRNAAARVHFTEEDAAALKPFMVARNRWHLALLLMQNPSIMKYRHFRLPRKMQQIEAPLMEQFTDTISSVRASVTMTMGDLRASMAGDSRRSTTGADGGGLSFEVTDSNSDRSAPSPSATEDYIRRPTTQTDRRHTQVIQPI